MSFFESVKGKPEDPILGLAVTFAADSHAKKVNLGIGAYKNAEGRPQLLASVAKAEKLLADKRLDKEYLPVLGNEAFIRTSLQLMFGNDSPLLKSDRLVGVQTLGGTGALRVGAEFLASTGVSDRIYVSDPTWLNHHLIFPKAGLRVMVHPYYDEKTRSIKVSEMLAAVDVMPANSILLLQPSCHNPTGLDPDMDTWRKLSTLIKRQRIIPFIDCAYLGFDRDVEQDAAVIRLFASDGHEMLVALSFSKNFGLYGERVGALAVVTGNGAMANKIAGEIKQIVRGNYSMPPLHGQRIVTTILQSEELKREWITELAQMRKRIQEMRETLVAQLKAKGAGARFDNLVKQKGLFSYSGLTEEQVARLRQDYGIYMLRTGRINVAGLNAGNVEYVADALLAVV